MWSSRLSSKRQSTNPVLTILSKVEHTENDHTCTTRWGGWMELMEARGDLPKTPSTTTCGWHWADPYPRTPTWVPHLSVLWLKNETLWLTNLSQSFPQMPAAISSESNKSLILNLNFTAQNCLQCSESNVVNLFRYSLFSPTNYGSRLRILVSCLFFKITTARAGQITAEAHLLIQFVISYTLWLRLSHTLRTIFQGPRSIRRILKSKFGSYIKFSLKVR